MSLQLGDVPVDFTAIDHPDRLELNRGHTPQFFLVVMNIVYAFFDTFGVIHSITEGGPNEATNIMVFKIYHDSFESLDLGGSAAQSVILMFIVISLTVIQFRYIERKVHY